MAYGFVSRQNVRGTVRGSELQPATSSYLGGVKVDEISIVINDGVISAVQTTATSTVFGISRPDNTSCSISGGVLTVNADVVRNMTTKQTFAGSDTSLAMKLQNAAEKITITSAAVISAAEFYITDQSILYHTANATNNWTLNIEGNNAVPLNTIMAVGDTVTVVHLVTNGATPYYVTAITIDGDPAAVTKWQNGTVPATGNANSIDSYTYTIIKTGDDVFTLMASQTKYA